MKKILNEELSLIKPTKEQIKEIKKQVNDFKRKLSDELRKTKHGGEVFIGGSFAKGTLIKKDEYDIDIFVRFDWKYEDISKLLEDVLKRCVKNQKIEKIHGSRDYFRLIFDNFYFEVIPVTKIKRPKHERNVTDLSYFHVSYIKKRIAGLEDEVLLAKAFCKANKVYGAETYVRGFSGYALELLILRYRSFQKMLRELIKVEDRLVIDIERHYKRRNEVFFELNEAKLHSPIILIDPTYKERNALASLSRETFKKFQESAKGFLKNPSLEHFTKKEINPDILEKRAKKKRAEYIHLKIFTDRQEGDIAGTKLKKFVMFLSEEIKVYFDILESEFDYSGDKDANFYLILKSKGEIIRIGPPMHTKKLRNHIRAFKKEHKRTFIRNGILHSKIPVDFNAKEFILNIPKEKLEEMSVVKLEII